MASFEELVQLNKEGFLGKLLAEKFNGVVGHTDYIKDGDVIIYFKSKEGTPHGQDIGETIDGCFKNLGYKLDNQSITECSVNILLYHEDKRTGFIVVVITTHYLLKGSRNNLRLTTTVC